VLINPARIPTSVRYRDALGPDCRAEDKGGGREQGAGGRAEAGEQGGSEHIHTT